MVMSEKTFRPPTSEDEASSTMEDTQSGRASPSSRVSPTSTPAVTPSMENRPSTSGEASPSSSVSPALSKRKDRCLTMHVTFDDIMTTPKIQRVAGKNPQRKTGKAGVVTSPAYIQEVKEKAAATATKETNKTKKGTGTGKGKGKGKAQKADKKKKEDPMDDAANFCGVCDGYYFDEDEDDDPSIECQSYAVWYHEAWVNAQGKQHFICDACDDTDSD